ncbi:hypothetical protein [Salinisphaera sp. LB1]|uniref:hypothetical protein n=1 Tax=Salinisphaera sp. LB1 TaxID=2183911 RepID=UPI0011AB6A5C|nr:hypothetical protein [Salinisphaera sp. LB1]
MKGNLCQQNSSSRYLRGTIPVRRNAPDPSARICVDLRIDARNKAVDREMCFSCVSSFGLAACTRPPNDDDARFGSLRFADLFLSADVRRCTQIHADLKSGELKR